MVRALQLARGGEGFVSPNPMVGAVVTARGRIIGEGFHRAFGGPHAEVNAIASVAEADRHLLREATIYVTLEPCSHYGKTPPCARLIIDTGIPRVVTGAPDPNPKVSGRGIRMLREAGIDVTEGVMLKECLDINRRFMTAQRLRRPYIQLKWAQTADGFIAGLDEEGNPMPVAISTPLTKTLMHRERALCDAILAGPNTIAIDNPRLDVRLWPGKNPLKVSFDSRKISPGSNFMAGKHILLNPEVALDENMHMLFERHSVSSLMVEGGAAVLRSFIDSGLYDEIRIETSPREILRGVKAPAIMPDALKEVAVTIVDGNTISLFQDVKNL